MHLSIDGLFIDENGIGESFVGWQRDALLGVWAPDLRYYDARACKGA